MWYRILHAIQYSGLIIAAAFLFNGIVCNPFTAADEAEVDTNTFVFSSSRALMNTNESGPSIQAVAAKRYGKLPLSFEENKGQLSDVVKYLSRGKGYTLYLTSGNVVLSLRSAPVRKNDEQALGKSAHIEETKQPENEVIRLKNIGANPDPKIIGLEELSAKSNYFISNDPAKWRTCVSNYAKVKVQDVYPGIDLVYYGNQHQLEYDWIVSPGADPKAIRFSVESKVDLKVDFQGNLILDEKGELLLNKPRIYQEGNGELTEIAGEYRILDRRQVGIQVSKYETSLPLVIDPVLVYSTYLGGAGDEGIAGVGGGIAVDKLGNAYVTGSTQSANFPTANPFQTSTGMGDVFITKINTAGNALIYSTYLGGSGGAGGSGIAVDSFGNAYVTGWTESIDFPTANAYQPIKRGQGDAFVTKLNAAGNGLIYSTYLGGSANDYGNGISLDTFGNAYVTGDTSSFNFPTLNPFLASKAGKEDIFVTKLNTTGNALVYSTYLGGSSHDYAGKQIAVDTSGNAYVTGQTMSFDFPTANPFQASYGGSWDAFVTKLNTTGNGLIYSTYLGGSSFDYGFGIAVDIFGNAYVTGLTSAMDFPTADPFQASFNGGAADAFVTKLNTAGNALVYSTYLGGSLNERAWAIVVDIFGNAYVTGWTESIDFPTADPIQGNYGGGSYDAFVTKLNTTGNALVYSTYLGGSDQDYGQRIAVDTFGNVYVQGYANSTDFPTANPFQDSSGGGYDAFVAKISMQSDFLRRGIRRRIRDRIFR